MLKRYARVVETALFVTDLAVTAAAFLLTYLLFRAAPVRLPFGPLFDLRHYLWLLLFIVPVEAILLQAGGIYRSQRTASLGGELWKIARAVTLTGLALFAFLALSKSGHISRPFISSFILLNLALLILVRVAVRGLARLARSQGHNTRTVLIVGTGPNARHLALRISEHPRWGLRLLGYVAEGDSAALADEGARPVLGTVRQIPHILREYVVDEVIVAVGRASLPDMEALFLFCEELGVNARLAVDLFPHRIARMSLEDLDGVPMLAFTTTPRDEWALAGKRALDIAGSACFMAAFSWLYLLIAAMIKATSRGPVFFRQERVGLNGRRFTFFKFRSMVADAEKRLGELAHLNEMDGPVFKIRRDPRITPVGRFLRKFSLDELPQMWNVLRGDMSLVGPRPPVPNEVAKYEPWERRRLSVRPGITCLWQVGGRNQVGFRKWMELDLEYIDNWSLGLDLKILLKTVPTVISGRGAS